jgi:hypothetical protein
MKIHYITIEGIESRGKLKLSDKGVTKVSPGDLVIWDIVPDEGVVRVNKILKDENSNNVFSIGPVRIKNSTAWLGVINPKITVAEEDYTIEYTAKDKELTFDPKIQVNS